MWRIERINFWETKWGMFMDVIRPRCIQSRSLKSKTGGELGTVAGQSRYLSFLGLHHHLIWSSKGPQRHSVGSPKAS